MANELTKSKRTRTSNITFLNKLFKTKIKLSLNPNLEKEQEDVDTTIAKLKEYSLVVEEKLKKIIKLSTKIQYSIEDD